MKELLKIIFKKSEGCALTAELVVFKSAINNLCFDNIHILARYYSAKMLSSLNKILYLGYKGKSSRK